MLHQQLHLTPGLTGLVARIERPVEPGRPRQYWDGTGNQWSSDPKARVVLTQDPDLAGVYPVEVPSAQTAAWPDAIYWVTVLNPAISGPDQVVVDPFPVEVCSGDDGGLAIPSYTVPVLGGVLTLYNARFSAPKS